MESASCGDLANAAAVSLGLLLRRGPRANAAEPAAGTRTTAEPTSGAATATGLGTPPKDEGHTAATDPTPESEPDERARPANESPRPSNPKSRAQRPPEPSADATRRFHVLLLAPFGTVDFGPLPNPSEGLGAGLGARYDGWRLLGVLRFFERETVSSRAFPEFGTSVARVDGELWGCREWRFGRAELGPCVSLGLSRLTAHATGPSVVLHAQRTDLLALGAGADARFFVSEWLAIFGTALLAVETSRPRLLIDGFGEVRHLAPLQISTLLGAEWIF